MAGLIYRIMVFGGNDLSRVKFWKIILSYYQCFGADSCKSQYDTWGRVTCHRYAPGAQVSVVLSTQA